MQLEIDALKGAAAWPGAGQRTLARPRPAPAELTLQQLDPDGATVQLATQTFTIPDYARGLVRRAASSWTGGRASVRWSLPSWAARGETHLWRTPSWSKS
jgi:hypothetical protein